MPAIKKNKAKLTMNDRKEHQVAVLRDLGKDLPFEITNKRVKGWSFIKQTENGYLEYKAHETITPSDIYTFIGALKALQDNEDFTTIGTLNGNEYYSLEIPLNILMKKYLHNNDKKLVINTFRRLATFQVTKHFNDGSESLKRFVYDYSLTANQSKIKITVSALFLNLLYDNPWLLNYDIMMQIKSNLAKALFLYFTSNRRKYYKQSTIENELGMKCNTSKITANNRIHIKKAINELVSTDKIKKVIKKYEYDNKSGNFEVEFETEN